MAPYNFPRSLKYALIDEGGNDDDPDDSGGRTSRGITQDEFDAWCDIHKQPHGDVWDATDGTIQAIYYAQFWHPWCDRLPGAIDYLFFDCAVNNGSAEAAVILQRALGDVKVDGHIGVVTVASAMKITDLRGFIDRFCEEHLQVYQKIVQNHPTDQKFYKGWFNRVQHERANAIEMVEDPLVS